MIKKFNTDREYEDWEERKTQERMLDDYFGSDIKIIGECYI